MQIGDRIELTTDIHSLLTTSHKTGDRGVIRKTGPGGSLYWLRMDDGRTQFARADEIKPALARTGPEFAKAHGNDSSTWTEADFDTEMNLAEIDLYRVCARKPRTTDIQPAA
ncbi:hypothetical protein [Streptomyces sp. AS02]|uniref:hypothetical protein n=1 Tax=Streptomyces sp. AS02 TaxID=2938946 RepID=UPI00202289DA|nr:hypothetical protein [Streptomyces sp. AS02]MCL8016867.1 hypothetical protein [Streptomyces sp. AS02]